MKYLIGIIILMSIISCAKLDQHNAVNACIQQQGIPFIDEDGIMYDCRKVE